MPVVVGVDDSDAAARAVAEAFDIARALHAQLTVAHMWEIDAAVGMGDLGGQGNMDWDLFDVLQAQQRRRMDGWSSRSPTGIRTPTWSRSFGMPARRKV